MGILINVIYSVGTYLFGVLLAPFTFIGSILNY